MRAGYGGGISIVKDYVRAIRPRPREAFLTLAFAPGEVAQVDWGEFGTIAVGDTRRRLSFFVMVLAWSRQMYVEFTLSQTMEQFLAAHVNAFNALGVPSKVWSTICVAPCFGIPEASARSSIRAISTSPVSAQPSHLVGS